MIFQIDNCPFCKIKLRKINQYGAHAYYPCSKCAYSVTKDNSVNIQKYKVGDFKINSYYYTAGYTGTDLSGSDIYYKNEYILSCNEIISANNTSLIELEKRLFTIKNFS